MQPIPEAVLRALRPRRSLPATVSPPARKPIEALRKKLTSGKFTYKEAVARGVRSQVFPELEPIRVAAHALIEDLSLERLRASSLESLAGFVCLTQMLSRDLAVVPALLAARGVADVVEIASLALDFSVNSPGNWTFEIYLQRMRGKRSWSGDDWRPVREAVCAASEPDYAAAKQRALTLGNEASPLLRAHLAYAFPDEPWGDAALVAWLAEEANVTLSDGGMLLASCRDAALVRVFLSKLSSFALTRYASDLAAGLPDADAIALLSEAIPPLLQKPQYGPLMKTPPRDVATALTYFRTPAAARALAPYAGHAILGVVVAAYFQDNPELSDALATGASTKAGRAAAERVLAQVEAQSDSGPIATDAELPALLRDKPWRKKVTKGRVLEGIDLLGGLPERVVLPAHARAVEQRFADARPMTPEEVAAYVAKSQKSGHQHADYEYERLPSGSFRYIVVPPELGLEAWNRGQGWVHAGHLALVARHGLAALPGFLNRESLRHFDYDGAEWQLAAIFSFDSPRIAPLVARLAARRKKHRRAARGWLKAHATSAALGLVPAAVGRLGADRDDAESALLYLVESGHAEAVSAAAKRYGSAPSQVIDELLARDPLSVGQAPPKIPEFLHAERLSVLRLNSGERLPAAAHGAVLEMLALSPLDAPYPGLARLTGVDPQTLAALAGVLLEQWLLADAPGRHEWLLHAVVHFPSDESERRLGSLARDWARRDRAKAERACVALAALASDVAFMHLGHISETSRFHDLRKIVQSLLDEAASARGLSRDELEDRTVPDLGLDSDGKLRVSFGKRQFVAQLDASLGLVVKDADGVVLRALPRKTKEDDEALAKAGSERLKALRADAATIAARQIRRLERAMVRGRSFSLSDFRARIVAHPVVSPIARALVWRATASGAHAFRIAEDGSFASVSDDAVTLGDDASIGVAHPLQLGDEAARWAELFADYEIIQPFEQLGRETFTCPAAEAGASKIQRFAGIQLDATKLLGTLEARDFERSDPSHVSFYRRTLATAQGEAAAELVISPGFEIAYLSEGAHPQTLAELRLADGATFGVVAPVAYSELVRDLEALRR